MTTIKRFTVTEFTVGDAIEETGRVVTVTAKSIDAAVNTVLATARRFNPKAHIGPTGRVVHDGEVSFSITSEKVR